MKDMHSEHAEGFLSEKDIEDEFAKGREIFTSEESKFPAIANWFKANNDHPKTIPHHEKIGGKYDCDLIVDEWIKFYLTMPSKANPIGMSGTGYSTGDTGTENAFLFRSKDVSVYFTAISPARSPDKIRIVLTNKYPVLIPIYFAETSKVENPSRDTESKLIELIKNDLKGIREVKATFDGKPLYGCVVIRNKPLHIPNIPKDNILGIPIERLQQYDYTIDLYHAGLWLLLKADNFTSGDHLLKITAKSINYEVEGHMEISAMV